MVKSGIRYSRTESFLFVIVAYAIAIIFSWLMLPYLERFHDLIQIGILDFFATLIIFIFSFRLNNSSVYDPYWSVIPIPVVLFFMSRNPEGNGIRQVLIIALVCFWGIRLTWNWVRGWPGLHHQDWRYDNLQKKHSKAYWLISIFGIHLFPTLLVFLGLVPLYYAMGNSAPLNGIDFLATAITLSAIMIELIADEQLRSFKKKKDFKAGEIIETGIWKYSRHPNYFGEVTFWIGLLIFGFNLNMSEFWWIYGGAICMILLFVFISIPMMEKRSLQSRPGFDEYRKRVSMLIPWFQNKK